MDNPVIRATPQSSEAEAYLLSCCFLDGAEVIPQCIERKLQAAAFYSPANQVVFGLMIDLYNANRPIELSVVVEELKTSRRLELAGGYSHLMKISGLVPTTIQVGYFIEKVRELHLLRELIRVATGAVEKCYAYEGEIEQFIDGVERDIFKVTQERVTDGAKPVRESIIAASSIIDRMAEKKGELTGVSSGFKDLDTFTYGFQRQELIVLAGRPSMGKTSLALNFVEAVAMPRKGQPEAVLFFSLEMGSSLLAMRLICARSKVNMKMLREGFISKDSDEMRRIKLAEEEFNKSKIFVDDSSSPTVMEIRAKARRLHKKQKLGLIVVDYLQLIGAIDPKNNREQQVAEMSRGLKALAKELDVPVIVLSQLNRSSEIHNRAPKLSDLRESGAIEQDADVVLMLARPKDSDERFQVAGETADLIVAKQRNGPVGEMKLTFLRDITRFQNYIA